MWHIVVVMTAFRRLDLIQMDDYFVSCDTYAKVNIIEQYVKRHLNAFTWLISWMSNKRNLIKTPINQNYDMIALLILVPFFMHTNPVVQFVKSDTCDV